MKKHIYFFILIPAIVTAIVGCGTRSQNRSDHASSHQQITPKRIANNDAMSFGGDSSGGGPGIICRNANGDITSAQVLDLYEAEIMNGLTIPASTGTFQDYLDQVANLLSFDPAFQAEFKNNITQLETQSIHLPPGVGLQVSTDLGTDQAIPVQSGCTLEAIGFYDRSRGLVVATDVFEKLSPRDQAAFYTHEAIYFLDRLFAERTESSLTRRLVGLLFSSQPDIQQIDHLSEEIRWTAPDQYPVTTQAPLSNGIKIQVIGNTGNFNLSYVVGCIGRYTRYLATERNQSFWTDELDGFQESALHGVINAEYDIRESCGKVVLWQPSLTVDDGKNPSQSSPTDHTPVPDQNFTLRIRILASDGTVIFDRNLDQHIWAEIPLYSL